MQTVVVHQRVILSPINSRFTQKFSIPGHHSSWYAQFRQTRHRHTLPSWLLRLSFRNMQQFHPHVLFRVNLRCSPSSSPPSFCGYMSQSTASSIPPCPLILKYFTTLKSPQTMPTHIPPLPGAQQPTSYTKGAQTLPHSPLHSAQVSLKRQ